MICLSRRHENSLLGLVTRDGSPNSFAEPGISPNYARSRDVRIEHLELSLSLEPEARTFVGMARLKLTPLPRFSGVVELDLDEVTVDGVTDANGKALPFTLADGKLAIRDAQLPGEVLVRWRGENPRRGLYFTGPAPFAPERPAMAWTQCQDEDAHFFFPCHDQPGLKHGWRIHLDAPEVYTLVSNGRLVEEHVAQGRRHTTWEQAEPMPAYLFTAVAARLERFEAAGGPVPVAFYVPEGEADLDDVLRAMGKTPLMIEAFARRLGVAFPWPRYDQVVVHDFVFGGMENVACTLMTDVLLVDERTTLEWDPDGLVSHELAHQWFGDLLTCQDWSQAWLNESWATFMETIWWEEDRSPADVIWYRWEQAQGYLAEDAGRYRRPIVSYQFREPIDVFDRHLYEKGACVLATMRAELGEDAFWAGARDYLTAHAHGVVHTRDFQRAMERASGQILDGFFDQWIHGAGHPALEVKLGEEAGLVTVSVKQTQSGAQTAEAFHFGLRLILVGEDGAERAVKLPVRERDRTWAIPVEGKIRAVRVDPNFEVLATIALSGPTPWMEALLVDASPVLALRAARGLLETGSVAGFRAAVGALRAHPHHGVRGAIAEAVGKRGGADARDALLAAFATEADPRAARMIAGALGGFREAVVADALLAKLAAGADTTWHLLGGVLLALGKTRDPRALPALRAHLRTESWASVVPQRALAGLAATRDAAVLDDLLAATAPDRADRERAAAAAALAELGDKVEAVRDRAAERLSELAVDGGFRVSYAAVQALGALKHPPTAALLQRLHRSAPDGRVQRAAFEAQRSVAQGRGGETAVAQLNARLDALTEENHKLRRRLEKLERHGEG